MSGQSRSVARSRFVCFVANGARSAKWRHLGCGGSADGSLSSHNRVRGDPQASKPETGTPGNLRISPRATPARAPLIRKRSQVRVLDRPSLKSLLTQRFATRSAGTRDRLELQRTDVAARCCPISAAHQHPQRFLRCLIVAHPVPVHAQGERRIGVPELVHHGARIGAERDQQRRERVPQLVRREPLRQWNLANLSEPLVRALHRRCEHPPADVAGPVPMAGDRTLGTATRTPATCGACRPRRRL
jgi:hypothetical protein